MARKVLNRKELREEADAAERAKPAKKKAAKKTPTKRRTKKKAPEEIRLKAYWGVFNQSLKRVALYEYSQRRQADKKAAELTTSSKQPHFVQQVKEAIEE